MVDLIQQYFEKIGDKACCFEDLLPYIHLDGDDLSRWTSYLKSVPSALVRIFPFFVVNQCAKKLLSDDHQ